jgi:hypothetical protein
MFSYRRNYNFQPTENHMTKIVKQSEMQPDNKRPEGEGSDLERAVKNYKPQEPKTPTVTDEKGETWEGRLKRQGKE